MFSHLGINAARTASVSQFTTVSHIVVTALVHWSNFIKCGALFHRAKECNS